MSLNTKTGKDLVFPEFDDIKVSTKTFIVMTSITINLKKLFEYLPIVEYNIVPKKRGRKKKMYNVDQNVVIDSGSIISMKFESQLKGVELKQKKNKVKKSKWFRNSFTVVMMTDNKPINFKICQNGVFQITGCKFDVHAENAIKYIWEYIKEEKDIYNFKDKEQFEILFIPAMRNIDFSLGFNVDREKLAKYMSTQTEFHSLLETSFGYTGVNIKIKILDDIRSMKIKKLIYKNNKNNENKEKEDENEAKNKKDPDDWIEIDTTYSEYLDILSEKERMKKINKERYSTFLVFHSGKCLLSSICADFSRDTYYYFLKIIRTAYNVIEERLIM
jgi:TATA-box binding protein (TBP) (component of TFIID and TFIIIB)